MYDHQSYCFEGKHRHQYIYGVNTIIHNASVHRVEVSTSITGFNSAQLMADL